jgi:hypothetical protein
VRLGCGFAFGFGAERGFALGFEELNFGRDDEGRERNEEREKLPPRTFASASAISEIPKPSVSMPACSATKPSDSVNINATERTVKFFMNFIKLTPIEFD